MTTMPATPTTTTTDPTGTPVRLCWGCDYPLGGLPDCRCPECGRPFNPRDGSTANHGLPLGWAGRWVLRPVGWPVLALALVPAAWLVWVSTDPELYYMGMSGFASALACFGVAAVQAGWIWTRWSVIRQREQPPDVRGDDRGRWRVLWCATAVVVAMVLVQVPLRLSFLAHQRAFERLVAEVQSNAPSAATLPGRGVGIYTLGTFNPAEANGRAVMFRVGDEGGFANLPGGESELRYNEGDHGRLWGAWYWFSED